jgi:hypothetical protein
VRASAETSGGGFTISEEIDALDTPLHVHEREGELLYVVEAPPAQSGGVIITAGSMYSASSAISPSATR